MSTALATIQIAETRLPAVLDAPSAFPDAFEAFEEMDGHLGDIRDRVSELVAVVEAYRSEFDRLESEVRTLALSYGFTTE